jgi:hypothetical protein
MMLAFAATIIILGVVLYQLITYTGEDVIAIDAADKPVAECPPEMGQMDQSGVANIKNDVSQMEQLLQASPSVQQGAQSQAYVWFEDVDQETLDNEFEHEE